MVVRMDSHVLVRNMYILYVDHVVLVYLLLLHVQIVKYIQIYVLDQDVINLNYLNFDLYGKFENVLDDIFFKKNWKKRSTQKVSILFRQTPKKTHFLRRCVKSLFISWPLCKNDCKCRNLSSASLLARPSIAWIDFCTCWSECRLGTPKASLAFSSNLANKV